MVFPGKRLLPSRNYRLCFQVLLVLICGVVVVRAVTAQQGGQLAKRFHELDTDQDGKLTREEVRSGRIFDRLDTDHDGHITLPEARSAVLAGALKGIDLNQSVFSGRPADESEGMSRLKPIPDAGISEKPMTADSALMNSANTQNSSVRKGPQLLSPGEHGVGSLISDFVIRDLSDTEFRLTDIIRQHGTRKTPASAIVIAMTSTSCPLSRKYLPTLASLAEKYAARGIQFVLVNPVAADKPSDMKSARAKLPDDVIYGFDAEEIIAEAVCAKTTTDVVVLDASRTVVFHGAIDDQYGFGFSRDAPRNTYLSDALDAILRDRLPIVAATDAPGCSLDLQQPKTSQTAITYHDRIARLMQRHCIECHREGGVGPFPLESYNDVTAHAPMIRDVVSRGIMPPWFARQPAGAVHSPWLNDRSLSASEKRDLLEWISGSQPEGDIRNAPLARQFADGWLIGKPDDVFQFDQPVRVKATGTMPYQNVTIDPRLDEDKWVQAIEIRPGVPGVVHHVLVFASSGEDNLRHRRDATADELRGYWGIYVPGNSTLSYPDGFAKKLPRGSKLRFQMHYTPNGTATEDTTRIGLVYARQPPKHEVKVASLANVRFKIPAGAANYSDKARISIPEEVQVMAFLPHMHLRGKAARYEAIFANGDKQILLDIPEYDFNWQLLYRLAEPITMRKGDSLEFTAWFDNSASNPANPNPDVAVRWGPQTTDEMLLGYVEYIVPGETPQP